MEKLLTVREHGFAGILYEGKRKKDQVIIYCGGGGSTVKESLECAAFIREAGLSVLVLGYYLWPDTPDRMEEIPVEYAERAVRFLKTVMGYRKVIIAGASEGATFALVCASLIDEIGGICAVTPMDYIMASPRSKESVKAVYTRNGKPLPFVHYPLSQHHAVSLLKGALQDQKYGLRRAIRYASDQADVRDEHYIPVENMKGKVLLIAPERDDIWASDEAVRRIEKRLARNHYPYPVRTVIYPEGSHMIGGSLDLSGFGASLFRQFMRAEHDHPQECEAARADCLKQMLMFFEE